MANFVLALYLALVDVAQPKDPTSAGSDVQNQPSAPCIEVGNFGHTGGASGTGNKVLGE